jgi:sugar lactone lactonase YvrE
LVRIPIERNGVPGDPEILVGEPGCEEGFEDDELYSMDGIAFDARGGLYALLVLQDKLVRIDVSTGDVTELVNGSGFHNPASLAFGTRSGERGTLFISNFALLSPEPPDSLGPAILKLNVGPPGKPSR